MCNDFKKNEVFTDVELSNLPEVCLSLMGKFKRQTGEWTHSIIIANKTLSGLQICCMVEKLIARSSAQGKMQCYVFTEPDSSPPNSTFYNSVVWDSLKEIQETEVEGNSPLENYFCHLSQNRINFLSRQVWLIGLNKNKKSRR